MKKPPSDSDLTFLPEQHSDFPLAIQVDPKLTLLFAGAMVVLGFAWWWYRHTRRGG